MSDLIPLHTRGEVNLAAPGNGLRSCGLERKTTMTAMTTMATVLVVRMHFGSPEHIPRYA